MPGVRSRDDPAAALEALVALGALSGVAEATERARRACTELRWHEALRRRGGSAAAAAESRVRGAHASAALEGASFDLALVRELFLDKATWSQHPDPLESTAHGVLQATAESERIVALVRTAPMQALVRLHLAAATPLLPAEQVGRPRRAGEACRELASLGPPPEAERVAGSLRGIAGLMLAASGRPGDPPQPANMQRLGDTPRPSALVVCAVVHAELAVLRPFVGSNGVVARALERALWVASGLDPTGVAVPEAGHLRGGGAAYRGALAAYATGSRQGVAAWILHCGGVVVAAAQEGRRVADAVQAGRLD